MSNQRTRALASVWSRVSAHAARKGLTLGIVFALSVFGCAKEESGLVESYLSGTVELKDANIDSPDNSGFQVLVLAPQDGRVDTVASAITNDAGDFSATVRAREEGIYPIVVRRSGGVLKQGQLVVSQGDSAVLALTLPATNKPMIIRSPENGAWMAYQNAKATYNRSITDLVSSGRATGDAIQTTILQSAGMMWDMSSIYPNTIGADLAAVESLMMLGSLETTKTDSIVVSRTRTLSPTNPGYVDAGRVAWRSTARTSGLDDAVELLEVMREAVEGSRKKAALQSEIVLAYQDSLQYDNARDASNRILAAYNDTEWGKWAESAIYELDNLRPGQRAPRIDATSRDGRRVQLSRIETPWVVVEFYEPRNQVYQRELQTRSDFLASESGATVTFVSVSLESDEDINEAFLERGLEGIHIVARDGFSDELSKRFNVKVLPKRFLIKDGVIVGKYSGQALADLIADIVNVPS
ncbi:MAG: redoxin domain-containing protein [Rhodothermales bacterium]|nr:redoxin domain-containing protein [Rhodothermales bacterium]